mmetsp:Transcript_21833/g.32423  ORF Transcript_21833/g.32423 Transcript_21833/m.32423 type:complete len:144 (-) Transcript_21833:36-467(-)
MPKNKGKGGKSKRKGKNKNDEQVKRELIEKDDGQEYAQITKILGNCRFEGFCFDGRNRLLHVRGKFRKRVWINRDDIVLVQLRDYQDEKADIIHKYNADEVRRLKKSGELPKRAAVGDDDLLNDGSDDLVDFNDDNIVSLDDL